MKSKNRPGYPRTGSEQVLLTRPPHQGSAKGPGGEETPGITAKPGQQEENQEGLAEERRRVGRVHPGAGGPGGSRSHRIPSSSSEGPPEAYLALRPQPALTSG